MIGMSTINTIRQRCRNGDSVSAVARDEGVSRDTVRKYRDMKDLNLKMPVRKKRQSKIDKYKDIIDQWLEEDKRSWHKQRHTGIRIWERLQKEFNADISYSTVQSYVRQKKEGKANVKDQFLDLVWSPGETQADFGQADFYYREVLTRMFYLVVVFPFSNVGFLQLFRGENAECVCQGLKAIFSFIGGVPEAIVFDNATGIGRRMGDAITTSELFGTFAAHYGFSFRFCNPHAGNEKGAVENMVGAMRRSLFVPKPRFQNLKVYNTRLLGECMDYCDKNHYRKGEPQLQLFMGDRLALSDLPTTEFQVMRYITAKTDKKGRICLEAKHWYSVDPSLALRDVIVGLGAFDVEIYTTEGKHIVTHPRSYGDMPTDVSDPTSQLLLLCRKPGAWINSQVRYSLPDDLRTFMDKLPKTDLKRALFTLRDISAASGYRPTVDAMAYVATSIGALDEASISVYAAGIAKGRGVIEYDDKVDMESYDKVFSLFLEGEK